MRISLFLHLSCFLIRCHIWPHSWRATGHSGLAGVARESPEALAPRIPPAGPVRNGSRLQRTRARLGSKAEAGARRGGGLKTIKTSETFGFILGGGMCFFKKSENHTAPKQNQTKSLTTDHFIKKDRKIPQTLLP